MSDFDLSEYDRNRSVERTVCENLVIDIIVDIIDQKTRLSQTKAESDIINDRHLETHTRTVTAGPSSRTGYASRAGADWYVSDREGYNDRPPCAE